MRRHPLVIAGALVLTACLTACATPAQRSRPGADGPTTRPSSATETGDATVRAQAEAWLDAARLPPGAVRSESVAGRFDSYTGWPCGPVEKLEGLWTISGATVHDTATWLIEDPTAGLTTTAVAPVSDDPAIDSATVGYIPEPGAQEGIVYTIIKTSDGVAVRAEVAALTATATCRPLPDGGTWGAPGQG